MTKLFRLYIDESGDHTYHSLDHESRRYLGLTGCIIEFEYYRTNFHPQFEALKQKHFPYSPDEPVIFHRTDIINRRGPFWRLRDRNNQMVFNKDLLEFLSQQDYRIISVVIDKKTHIERYGEAAFHPYHYCLAAMLERYCRFLNTIHAMGDVLAESRGGSEDRQLKEAYKAVYNSGTQLRNPAYFQKALTSHEIKIKPKTANIAGLQISDVLAYPSKQEVLFEQNLISDPGDTFGKEIWERIKDKYVHDVSGTVIHQYGKILLK